MHFETESTPEGAVRMRCEGDLTIYHAAEIKQHLLDAVRSAPSLELDLSAIGEIDTAGVQLLVMAKRESQGLRRSLRIVAHSAAVREVIDFYNMNAFFGDPMLIPADR